jgi:hypothetical protein
MPKFKSDAALVGNKIYKANKTAVDLFATDEVVSA